MADVQALLSRREIQDLTGLSETTLWRYVARGELPVVRFGGRVLFRPGDVESFIARHVTPTPRRGYQPHKRQEMRS